MEDIEIEFLDIMICFITDSLIYQFFLFYGILTIPMGKINIIRIGKGVDILNRLAKEKISISFTT